MNYNKLVIFDLDGVLIDSKDLHFVALNRALYELGIGVITREEHLSTFDGLPTKKKLSILTDQNRIRLCDWQDIEAAKQRETLRYLEEVLEKDERLISIFKKLREEYNVKIAVASNSVPATVEMCLRKLGLNFYIDFYSGNDVKRPKPFPEIYWRCMTECNAIPATTLIVEDSHIGRQGVVDSKARLFAVENKNWDEIEFFKRMDELVNNERNNTSWIGGNLNILIPMAGLGSRFSQAGYTFPKPLIEVDGKPMIQRVVENLNIEANYIFVVREEHYEKYNLKYLLNLIAPNCTVIQQKGNLEGAACSALLAEEYINNDNPLLIANSDQWIDWDSNNVMYSFSNDAIDGAILTFKATHPKWSFAAVDGDNFVTQVAEKKPISDNATVGVYYWRKGSDFVSCAHSMIEKNIRTNGEFYICPVYNEAIEEGLIIKAKEVPAMYGLGTPEDLDAFLKKGII